MKLIVLLALCASPAFADEIWVTNERDDTISVIDTETLEVTRTIPVGERPRGITFAHDYSVVYVCASASNRISGQTMSVSCLSASGRPKTIPPSALRSIPPSSARIASPKVATRR